MLAKATRAFERRKVPAPFEGGYGVDSLGNQCIPRPVTRRDRAWFFSVL